MTKDEFLKGKEDYIHKISNYPSCDIDSNYLQEGQKAYHDGKDIKDNPYQPLSTKTDCISWDTGWRLEDLTKYTLANEDYLKEDCFSTIILATDWEVKSIK